MKVHEEILEFVDDQHGPTGWDPMHEDVCAKMVQIIESFVVHLQWRQKADHHMQSSRALAQLRRAVRSRKPITMREISRFEGCIMELSQKLVEREKANHILREHLATLSHHRALKN